MPRRGRCGRVGVAARGQRESERVAAAASEDRRPRRRTTWAFGLSLFAVAWSVALVGAVFVVPAYNDGSTLAQENGAWVAITAAVPAMLAVAAFAGLHRRCARGSRRGSAFAWAAILVLLAFSVVAMWSIGMLSIVAALALLAGAALTPKPAHQRLEIQSPFR